MDAPRSTLVIREIPFGSWLFGLFLMSFGIIPYYMSHSLVPVLIIISAIGVIDLLSSTILVVTADRNSQTVTMRYRGPLQWKNKEIPFGEIQAIEVQASRGGRETQSSYRIAIIQRDGQIVPFHRAYTSGWQSKERKAKRLREFLGVGGQDGTISGMIQAAEPLIRRNFQEQLGSAPGADGQEQTTDGVRWTIQTTSFGSAPITRWFSSDFQSPGIFIFIAQNAAGQKQLGGLLAGVGTKMAETAMTIYGFSSEDTPGLAGAQLLSPLDARIESNFTVLVSDVPAAQRILNTYTIQALADWAQRYPLQPGMSRQLLQQVVVLFGPRGVTVAAMGSVMTEIVDELKNLGVALVKAQ